MELKQFSGTKLFPYFSTKNNFKKTWSEIRRHQTFHKRKKKKGENVQKLTDIFELGARNIKFIQQSKAGFFNVHGRDDGETWSPT